MWSLNGGVALSYLGAWAAGTYQPGQIVVDNGVEYMCVRTTTKRPTGWPGSAATTYGTTLPASPVDGQEAVLVDNVTNPSYQWRFRYNASSSSAYKWEFVGGYPYFSATNTVEGPFPVGSWANSYVALTVPRAGDYLINGWFKFQNNAATLQQVYIGDPANQYSSDTIQATSETTVFAAWFKPGATAGSTIYVQVYTNGSQIVANQQNITATPKKVS